MERECQEHAVADVAARIIWSFRVITLLKAWRYICAARWLHLPLILKNGVPKSLLLSLQLGVSQLGVASDLSHENLTFCPVT